MDAGEQLKDQLKDQLRDQLRDQLGDQLRDQLWGQLGGQIGGQLGDPLRDPLWEQLRDQLWEQLREQLRDQLRGQLKEQLWGQLASQLWEQLRDQLGEQLGVQLKNASYSYWHMAWAGWMEGGLAVGANLDHEMYQDYRLWCLSCPMVIARRGLVVTCQNPTAIHWGDGGLHNEQGPACEFSDGWKLWAVDGVRVDEQIALRPETQTIEQIHAEENEEVRRVRIDRFGWSRYLEESESTVLDCGRNDIENTYEILADTPVGQRLITHCPSTGRRYALGIPGDPVTTRDEAQQRLWGDRQVGGQPITIIGRT